MYDSVNDSSQEKISASDKVSRKKGAVPARTKSSSQAPRDENPSLESAIWDSVLSILEQDIDSQIFCAYLKPLRLSSFDAHKNEAVILAPSSLVCNHVERVYLSRLSSALATVLIEFLEGFTPEKAACVTIRLCVDPRLERSSESPLAHKPFVVVKKIPAANAAVNNPKHEHSLELRRPSSSLGISSLQTSISDRVRQFDTGLNSKYTFSNFIVGNNNQFSHAASMRVAEQPGQSYNPLFIYGGVGLGKTHLLHAIGNAVLENSPKARVVYLSSETFTNELIQALRNAKMDEFKRRMRSIEVLLIDDIQFMCGKERTQEEFFHTFNTLYDARHQIVITSDKIPQDIPGMEERLQTRFSWGLTADLQAPDFETRVAILKRKASLDGYALPEEVAQFIAEKISSNVRELEGALTRLSAVSSLQGVGLTLQVAQSALQPLLQQRPAAISILDIKKMVADHFGLKVSEIISKRRTKNLSFPRHIAMYLCRKHTTSSYPEIGGQFGGRDHSSVIHAANVVSSKVASDQRIRDLVGEIERRLFQP